MFFASNIKLLRKRRGRTQDEMAAFLDMKRSTLSGYENGIAQPGLETLIILSKYFKISIDTLVGVDFEKLSESQLGELESGYDVFVTGSKLRVLATTVDSENNENIELVNEKAKAGYQNGYADPEYIRALPVFQLPFLSKNKKYRSFQISGDSMLPIPNGAIVTGEFVIDWIYLNEGDACIVLTIDDGVVFKVLGSKIRKDMPLKLFSLNSFYKPYEVPIDQVKEIWKFVHYISAEMPEFDPSIELHKEVANMKKELDMLKNKIN